MLAEAYVIGSIVFSVIFVGFAYCSSRSASIEWPLLEESLRCPRCGAEMESVGGGAGCLGISVRYVVPPITVLRCSRCGYEERSWT